MKNLKFKILLFLAVLMGCSSLKNKNVNTVDTKKVTKEPITTEFYSILAFANPKSKIYKLSELKLFDLKLINIGTKDLYVPEWLDKSYGKHSELYIELLKKSNGEYKKYEQKDKIVLTNIHTETNNRNILSTKNGSCLSFKKLRLDSFLKIVDEGEYYAKVFIDLSNFGYFKLIEANTFFEVVSDSIDINKLKKSNKSILKRTEAEQYEADLKMRIENFYKKKSRIKKDSIN